MADSDQVIVKFGAQADDFEATIGQITSSLSGLLSPINDVTEGLSKLAETFVAAFAVEKIEEFVEHVVDLGVQLQHMSEATGLSIQQLSALNVAAQENDVSLDTLQRTFTILARNIQSAESGTGRAAAAFNALGITQQTLNDHGNDTSYMFELVAQKLEQYADGGNKAALISDIFGARMSSLNPILHQVAEEGMAGLQQKAQDLGVSFDSDFAESAEKAKKAIADFQLASQGLETELASKLLPALTAAANAMRQLLFSDLSVEQAPLKQLEQDAATLQKQIDDMAKSPLFGSEAYYQAVDQLTAIQAKIEQIKTTMTEASGSDKPAAPFVDPNAAAKAKAAADAQLAVWQAETKQQAEAVKAMYDEGTRNLNDYINGEKELVNEAYEHKKQTLEAELASLQGNAAAQDVIQKQIEAAGVERDTQLAELDKTKWQQQVQNAEAASNELISQADKVLAAAKQKFQDQYKSHQITLDQETAAVTAAVNKWKTDTEAAISAIQVMYGQDQVKFQELEKKKVDIDTQANNEIEEVNRKAAQQTQQQWTQAFNSMLQPFNTMISGLIKGSETWQQAFTRLLEDLLMKFIESCERQLVEWIVTENTKTATTVAASAAGSAAQTAAATAAIGKDASTAAAGAYSSVAQIPYVGWLLAPAAAAAAFVAVEAFGKFDQGTDYVPTTGLAMIHQGEMVVPAGTAAAVRSGDAVIGGGGGGGGGGSSTSISNGGNIQVHFAVNAVDAGSVSRLFAQNYQQFGNQIARAIRNGNTALSGQLGKLAGLPTSS